jgi:hypothetical protein
MSALSCEIVSFSLLSLTDRQSCSIPCFKPHIESHNEQDNEKLAKPLSPPRTPSNVPVETLSSFPRSLVSTNNLPTLQRKYPELLAQLRRVYQATLSPDENDDDIADKRKPRKPAEPWTQEKADERALGLLIELQLRDEGVAEFLELVKLKLDEKEKQSEAV